MLWADPKDLGRAVEAVAIAITTLRDVTGRAVQTSVDMDRLQRDILGVMAAHFDRPSAILPEGDCFAVGFGLPTEQTFPADGGAEYRRRKYGV